MKTNFTHLMAALVLLAAVVMGCKKPEEEIKAPEVAMVEDSIVVTHNTALLYAEVKDNGGAKVVKCGFCYATIGGTADTIYCDGTDGSFFVELRNLPSATSYACRAFAENAAGRSYSDEFTFTTLSDPFPVVKTYMPTEITHSTALASGNVVSDGGQEVRERGVCYSQSEHPTINDSHIACGSGLGRFECALTDLSANTKYNIRAYAVCSEGVYYGNEQYFWTEVLPIEVLTLTVADVTASRVKAEGRVVRDGGFAVTERGFCWGTEHGPTVEGYHVWAGYGTGEFSHYFSGLERGVTHYVRAYAINEAGIAYGEELEFVPNDPFMSWPDGTLPGLFSISSDQQVRFSQGNLQFNPSGGVWRFAEHQWDFVGGSGCYYYTEENDDIKYYSMGTVFKDGAQCDNTLVFGNYEGWVDLFGWGTSGWDNGNLYYRPYDYVSHGYDYSYYGPVGNFDLTGDYANADWGIYNTVSNGGSRQWRTPTAEEFTYLLMERNTPSGIRFVKAIVAGIRGLIILPDDWSSSTYYLKSINVNIDYAANKITARDWLDVLEPAGAVFLPAAGDRYQSVSGESPVYYWNDDLYTSYCFGHYWTSTHGTGVDYASDLFFYGCEEGMYTPYMINDVTARCNGNSVRLISVE